MGQKASKLKASLLNDTPDVVNPATSENQTSGDQKTQIVGTTGNVAEVNDSNQLHTVMRGHVCTNNSTTTPLLANEVWTGTAEDILDYGGVSLFVTSDVASATMGVEVQYSKDGTTNWRTAESYTLVAGSEKWFSPPAFGAYFRAKFTNGTSDQTSFELTTTLRKTPFKWSSHNIDIAIKDQDDAELVKAVITGKKANGDYDNVSLTNGANMKISLEELESGVSENSNTSLRTTLVDGSDNIIHSSPDSDGNYKIGVSAIQQILTSTGNSTTTNIASGATFTGTAEETFGINGIQVFHSADKDCTVYLDQSLDSTFADSTQTLTFSALCLANEPCTRVIASVAPYFRLRITNTSDAITTKISSSAAMTPIISTLPSELSPSGNLQVVSSLRGNENYERHVWVNPTNEMAISPVYRMVGTNFDGETKDTNFWTDGSLLDGTITQTGGEIDLHTNEAGATASSSAKYTSVRKSRFVAGSAQLFSGGFNFKTTYTPNNIRRAGAYTTTATINTPVDGFYFELSGSVFSVNSRADSGTVNSVASGSFNGNKGVSFIPTTDQYYNLQIEYTPLAALFYVNGELLHKMQGAHLSHFMTLPITIENLNTTGSVDVSFETVGMYIARQGELHTNSTSKYILTGTDVLKYGAGVLKRIIVSDNIGRVIIYDNTAASGKVITNLDTAQGSEPAGTVDFEIPFNDGLTIDITNNVGVTVVYE